jgi:peptidoglycan hydrolase-like protein with peptidoglycan-binding domain
MNEITKPFIIKIQKFFNLNPTGEYDSHTEAAVKNYQYLIKENPTGKINTATYNSLASRYLSA